MILFGPNGKRYAIPPQADLSEGEVAAIFATLDFGSNGSEGQSFQKSYRHFWYSSSLVVNSGVKANWFNFTFKS